MVYKKDRGFTLIELMIVLVIIGILATLGLPQFGRTKERALGNEAKGNLKLIAAAEKIYKIEMNNYYPSVDGSWNVEDDITDINRDLKLSLTQTNWDYRVWGRSVEFAIYAKRQGTGTYSTCEYWIYQDIEEPVVSSGTCP